MSMLGNQETFSLTAKAAESHGLLRFVHWLLQKHQAEFDNLPEAKSRQLTQLRAASQAALEMDTVLQSPERPFNREQCQGLFRYYVRFLVLYMRAGGVYRPKCHQLLHMIQRAQFKGNPRLYSTYRDESLNGTVAQIARSAHRRSWANIIHWKLSMYHQKVFREYTET